MAGFLSTDQINKVRTLMGTLHDTFARTITVYKNAKKKKNFAPKMNPKN